MSRKIIEKQDQFANAGFTINARQGENLLNITPANASRFAQCPSCQTFSAELISILNGIVTMWCGLCRDHFKLPQFSVVWKPESQPLHNTGRGLEDQQQRPLPQNPQLSDENRKQLYHFASLTKGKENHFWHSDCGRLAIEQVLTIQELDKKIPRMREKTVSINL